MTSRLAGLRWRAEGEGPCLVLIHGWGLSLDYWDLVAPLLAREFRVLCFDRRGFGGSSGKPSLAADREDLLALLDANGAAAATVLGMSQGARVALDLAVTQPQRARALVLDGAPQIDTGSELQLDEYRRIRNEQGLAALRTAIAAHPLMQIVSDAPQAREILHRCLDHYSGEDLDAPGQAHTGARAAAVTVPSLILVGQCDSAARREAAQLLHGRIPGAHLAQIAGAGHLAALDAPVAYSAAISRFFRDLPR